MKYLNWNQKIITDFSPAFVSEMYEKGYVFTRLGKGVMQQTRSVRINLSKFELTSENRRILKKVSEISLQSTKVPLTDYSYSLGKLAKDFYETKFGPGIMSAQKIKEMLTDENSSNFNKCLQYLQDKHEIGYAIGYENAVLFHYSYPFYRIDIAPKDMGLGMMIKAIVWAKDENKEYVYLGSLQRPGDVYKLQFTGLEWFDSKIWQTDITVAKKILGTPTLQTL
jgi:arginyl-tRNA--protein-N-Asp/Glu arginylyltransferase